jgi:hypothetical protein
VVGPFLLIGVRFQHFFDYEPMIRPALVTNVLGGRESLVVPALLALDHDALGTPPVDPAHLHVLNLVMRLDALDYLTSQLSSSPVSVSVSPPANGHNKKTRL